VLTEDRSGLSDVVRGGAGKDNKRAAVYNIGDNMCR